MKNFFQTFVMCFVIITIFLTFGGYLIFESFWGAIGFVALIFAILITTFVSQETKLEVLEARIKALENQEQAKK